MRQIHHKYIHLSISIFVMCFQFPDDLWTLVIASSYSHIVQFTRDTSMLQSLPSFSLFSDHQTTPSYYAIIFNHTTIVQHLSVPILGKQSRLLHLSTVLWPQNHIKTRVCILKLSNVLHTVLDVSVN